MTTAAPEEKLLYSVRDLKTALGVCSATVHALFNKGEFRKVRIGGYVFAPTEDVKAFIARGGTPHVTGQGRRKESQPTHP